MKRNRKLCAIATIVTTGLLFFSGCKSDVDFSNIDKHAEIDMALALPVGTMSATINDFIQDEKVQEHLIVNDEGVLQVNFDYDISRPYTTIGLTDYATNGASSTAVYPQTGATITGNGTPLSPISLPVTIRLDKCNTAAYFAQTGRIDSMLITDAKFSITLSTESWTLPKEYVSSVRLVLGDRFHRPGGKVFFPEFKDFGQPMELEIHDFYADLTIDNKLVPATKEAADANVVNTLDATIQVILNVPNSTTVPVTSESKLNVSMHTDLLKYEALWGYFIPGSKMREKGTEDIQKDLDGWAKLRKCTLMLAKPRIDVWATTEIVAPLVIKVNEISVTSTESSLTEKAQFTEGDHTTWHYITPEIYNEQFKTRPGITYSAPYYMTEDPAQGDLARLFRLRPDILNYDFNIEVDPEHRHMQHRVTPNSNIDLSTKIHIPLSFNKGMELNYCDTAKDVEIKLNLDSIVNEVQILDSLKATDIRIRLLAESTIPLDVKLGYSFLDELDQPIDFNNLVDNDTIIIKAPTELLQGVVNPDKPGKAEIIVNVSKEEFDKLRLIRKIKYDAYLMTNNQTFDDNPGTKYVSLLPSSGLKVNIGASANLEALLNLDFNNDKKK